MADEKSTRTKMIEEAKVDEDMGGLKNIVKKGAVAASSLLDKLGVRQEKEYEGKSKEELQVKKAAGGTLKDVDSEENPGLAKLPEGVRNKMGYKRSGGKVGYKTGGSVSKRADGCAIRGKTRGRMV